MDISRPQPLNPIQALLAMTCFYSVKPWSRQATAATVHPGRPLCSRASAGQGFSSITAAAPDLRCNLAGPSTASPLQSAAAKLRYQPGPSHGLSDRGIPEDCMDKARPKLAALDAASAGYRMAGLGPGLAEERGRGFSCAESSSSSSSGAAGVRLASVRRSATRRPELLAKRWQMHGSLGHDAGSQATTLRRPGEGAFVSECCIELVTSNSVMLII